MTLGTPYFPGLVCCCHGRACLSCAALVKSIAGLLYDLMTHRIAVNDTVHLEFPLLEAYRAEIGLKRFCVRQACIPFAEGERAAAVGLPFAEEDFMGEPAF